MILFKQMASTLKKGFNLAQNYILPNFPGTYPIQAGYSAARSFFPQPQRTTLVPSIVSNTPGASSQGYRTQTKDAITLGDRFAGWFQSSKNAWENVYENYKKRYMGRQIGDKAVDVAGSILERTSDIVVSGLAQYFQKKMGLVPNRTENYERVENVPVRNRDVIYHLNETQSNAAVTTPDDRSLWDILAGNQPKGEFNIGFPQSAAIPAAPVNTIIEQAGGLSLNPQTLLIGGVVIIGGWFLLRRLR